MSGFNDHLRKKEEITINNLSSLIIQMKALALILWMMIFILWAYTLYWKHQLYFLYCIWIASDVHIIITHVHIISEHRNISRLRMRFSQLQLMCTQFKQHSMDYHFRFYVEHKLLDKNEITDFINNISKTTKKKLAA